MKPLNCTVKEYFAIQDSKRVYAETKRIKKILDAKYKKVNLAELILSLKERAVKMSPLPHGRQKLLCHIVFLA